MTVVTLSEAQRDRRVFPNTPTADDRNAGGSASVEGEGMIMMTMVKMIEGADDRCQDGLTMIDDR